MKKPPYLSHYLVLRDLLNNVDVRVYSDVIIYHTSRIENVKLKLVKDGLEFVEDILKESPYSYYKPYILIRSKKNINRAKKLLELYSTDSVLTFLEHKKKVS